MTDTIEKALDSLPLVAPAATTDVEVNRERFYRRNFLALAGDYILFGVAFAILSPRVLPPNFVDQLTGDPVLVGLAGLLFSVVWMMPQLLFAPYVNRAARKKPYITIPAFPARVIFIPVGLLMIAIGPGSAGLLILVFLSGYVALAVGDGCSVIPWMDILGSSLNNRLRGRLFAWSQAATGVLVTLIAVPLVRHVLGPEGPTFPNNYALLMIVVGALLTLALASFVLTREGHSPPPQDSPGLREYGPFLARLLREDAGFRRYLLARFAYDLIRIAEPFYIVYATSVIGQEDAVAVSDEILLATLTGVVAALIMGQLNAKRGPRDVVRLATSAALIAPLLALSGRIVGPVGIHLTWIALSLAGTAFVPGFLNWVVEYAPPGYRPIYSGMANTFSIAALLSPLIGGLIVAQFSYDVLFVVAALIGAVAMLLVWRLPKPGAA